MMPGLQNIPQDGAGVTALFRADTAIYTPCPVCGQAPLRHLVVTDDGPALRLLGPLNCGRMLTTEEQQALLEKALDLQVLLVRDIAQRRLDQQAAEAEVAPC